MFQVKSHFVIGPGLVCQVMPRGQRLTPQPADKEISCLATDGGSVHVMWLCTGAGCSSLTALSCFRCRNDLDTNSNQSNTVASETDWPFLLVSFLYTTLHHFLYLYLSATLRVSSRMDAMKQCVIVSILKRFIVPPLSWMAGLFSSPSSQCGRSEQLLPLLRLHVVEPHFDYDLSLKVLC